MLSPNVIAALIGAVLGVLAAIPTSLLALAVSRRRSRRLKLPPAPQGEYPPVVVVARLNPKAQVLLDGFDAEEQKFRAAAALLTCHGRSGTAQAALNLAGALAENRARILDLATGQSGRGPALDATIETLKAIEEFIGYKDDLSIPMPGIVD